MSQIRYKFRLFVTGDSPNSVHAQANLVALCNTYLPERYEIEVVDVMETPLAALNEKILCTPVLVRLSPLPPRRIVGSLSETQAVVDYIIQS